MDELQARGRQLGNPLARRIAMVGKETYNKNLGKQQGTTRTIYDTIPLAGQPNVFNFFENLANKGYPWTNLNRNSFTDQEAMNVQRAYLSIIISSNDTAYGNAAADTWQILGLSEAAGVPAVTGSNLISKFLAAQASIFISGQQTLKNFTFLSADPRFNYGNVGITEGIAYDNKATGGSYTAITRGREIYEFASPAVIPPNRDFIVSVQVPPYSAISSTGKNYYLRLTLEGFGAIPSVEGTL